MFRKTASVIFKDPKHALIYEAILDVASRQEVADVLSVSDYLQKKDRLNEPVLK